MNLCPVCGEPLNPEAKRCSCCGSENPFYRSAPEVEEVPEEVPVPAEPVNPEPAPVAPAPVQPDASGDVAERAMKSVVIIYAEGESTLGKGTGWITRDGYIVTNAHVVLDKANSFQSIKNISCKFNSAQSSGRVRLEPLVMDAVEDVAILKPIGSTVPSDIPGLSLSMVPTKMGQKVFTIGAPLHYGLTYSDGSISNPAYRRDVNKFPIIQTNIELNHGNSGGPLLDMEGNVVGMATFMETTPVSIDGIIKMERIVGYGFCISATAIQHCLASDKLKGVKTRC